MLRQLVKHYIQLCLSDRFWKKLACESADWVMKILPHPHRPEPSRILQSSSTATVSVELKNKKQRIHSKPRHPPCPSLTVAIWFLPFGLRPRLTPLPALHLRPQVRTGSGLQLTRPTRSRDFSASTTHEPVPTANLLTLHSSFCGES